GDVEGCQLSPAQSPWCAERAAGRAAQALPRGPLAPVANPRFLARYFEASLLLVLVQNQLAQMRQGHNPQHLPRKEKPYELDARAAETVHCCGRYCIAPQRSLWICTAARMPELYRSAMPRPGRAFQMAQHGAWFNVGRRRWRTSVTTRRCVGRSLPQAQSRGQTHPAPRRPADCQV